MHVRYVKFRFFSKEEFAFEFYNSDNKIIYSTSNSSNEKYTIEKSLWNKLKNYKSGSKIKVRAKFCVKEGKFKAGPYYSSLYVYTLKK